jgi:hypothetical protein
MQEDFLHYIWQYQKLTASLLQTVKGNKIQVISAGELNTNSGPDFYNSRIVIGNQEWVGTVEIHLKASDWFVHKHQGDSAYNNVVLHVVWENDVAVFDTNQNKLETLVLKDIVDEKLLLSYKSLLLKKNWINCENQIHSIDEFILSFWKEKLLIQRLQRKANELQYRLLALGNNWESLLFMMLAKNFGLKINASEFQLLAQNISFGVFKKELSNQLSLEALLFGHSNLLEELMQDPYYKSLQKEYLYLKQKHELHESLVKLQFFRLRPASFPTIRLSQFSVLYYNQKSLFSKVISVITISDIYELFSGAASEYWDEHYTFGKRSPKRKKQLSKSFIDLLVLNTIIPLKFIYAKSIGKENFEELLKLYKSINPEKNTTIKKFKELGLKIASSADSQSLIELKTKYCNQHKCLHCEIGNKLLYPS